MFLFLSGCLKCKNELRTYEDLDIGLVYSKLFLSHFNSTLFNSCFNFLNNNYKVIVNDQ